MAIPRLSLPNDASVTGMSVVKQDNVYDTYPIHCHEFDELFFNSGGARYIISTVSTRSSRRDRWCSSDRTTRIAIRR